MGGNFLGDNFQGGIFRGGNFIEGNFHRWEFLLGAIFIGGNFLGGWGTIIQGEIFWGAISTEPTQMTHFFKKIENELVNL